jgi:hypothetical protein
VNVTTRNTPGDQLRLQVTRKFASAQAKAAEASNSVAAQLLQAAKMMGENSDMSAQKASAIAQLLDSNKANVDALIVNIGKAVMHDLLAEVEYLETTKNATGSRCRAAA